jgi:hypothetical protein
VSSLPFPFTKSMSKGRKGTSPSASREGATRGIRSGHRRSAAGESSEQTPVPASDQIDAMVRELEGWQGEALARFRDLIKKALPDVVEEIKWRKPSNPDGSPVWSRNGIICVANVWKGHTRITFAQGALLKDPKHTFNAALNGNYMRAVDLREGDELDEKAFTDLVRAAAALNSEEAGRKKVQARKR